MKQHNKLWHICCLVSGFPDGEFESGGQDKYNYSSIRHSLFRLFWLRLRALIFNLKAASLTAIFGGASPILKDHSQSKRQQPEVLQGTLLHVHEKGTHIVENPRTSKVFLFYTMGTTDHSGVLFRQILQVQGLFYCRFKAFFKGPNLK